MAPTLLAATPLLLIAASQAPLLEVQPSELKGRTLVLERFNVTVDAPSGEWRWMKAPQPEDKDSVRTTYVCEQATTGRRFALTIINAGVDAADRSTVVTSMVDGARRAGYAVEVLSSTVDDSPSPRSVHGSWRTSLPDGSSLTTHVCFVAARLGYIFLYQGVEASTPQDFRAFVGSFRLLRPVLPPGSGARLRTTIYYVLLVFGAGVAVVWNLAFGRRKWINPGTAATALAAAFLILRLCLMSYQSIRVMPAEGVPGSDLAGAMAEGTVPLAIGVVLWIVSSRRHRARHLPIASPSSTGRG